jgi:hypothetical protein
MHFVWKKVSFEAEGWYTYIPATLFGEHDLSHAIAPNVTWYQHNEESSPISDLGISQPLERAFSYLSSDLNLIFALCPNSQTLRPPPRKSDFDIHFKHTLFSPLFTQKGLFGAESSFSHTWPHTFYSSQ